MLRGGRSPEARRVPPSRVVAGLLDLSREKIDEAAHGYVHIHMMGFVLMMDFVLFVFLASLTFWRWMIYMEPGANGASMPAWNSWPQP